MTLAPILPGPGRTLIFSGLLVLLAACASGPDAPPPTLPAARAAVDGLVVGDAVRYAPVEVQTARERLDAAEAEWRAERYDRTAMLADEALVSVRLAESRTMAARAEEARVDVERTIRTLENEVGLGASPPAPPASVVPPSPPLPPLGTGGVRTPSTVTGGLAGTTSSGGLAPNRQSPGRQSPGPSVQRP